MKIIPIKNFNIKTCFIQFLWFFRLKCWFKGQIISRIHLSLPNAYKLMCFDWNINGNRDDNFFDWDYWSLHWPKKLTLEVSAIFLLMFGYRNIVVYIKWNMTSTEKCFIEDFHDFCNFSWFYSRFYCFIQDCNESFSCFIETLVICFTISP